MNRVAAAVAALALGGCATLPPPAAVPEPAARRAALQSLADWRLDGRVAVAAGEEGLSGRLRWSQSGRRADIEIRGPIGSTALSIEVDGARVAVTDGRGETHVSEDGRFGIGGGGRVVLLPVSQMRYWLLGVPAPGEAFEEASGGEAGPAWLEQSGWRIEYSRFRDAPAGAMPGRIELRQGDIRIRVVVADWRPGR